MADRVKGERLAIRLQRKLPLPEGRIYALAPPTHAVGDAPPHPLGHLMAIYSLEVTAFSRSRGEAMVPKAAYRSASLLVDQRTAKVSDYRRRRGVELAFMMFPHGLAMDREAAWNAVEVRENRRDACVGREVRFALPVELSSAGRERCARRLSQYLVDQDDLFVDCAIHSANPAGDQRNWHVHALIPTRSMDVGGDLTNKVRHWDDPRLGPKTIKALREAWAEIANDELAIEGHVGVCIDARSNRARGIAARAGVKMGLAATAIERRTGLPSAKRLHIETPIEIDLEIVAAVRAFEAATATERSSKRPQQAAPHRFSIDIDAILARLRDEARQAINRAFQARHFQKQPASETKTGMNFMNRPRPKTAAFTTRRRSTVAATYDAVHRKRTLPRTSTPPNAGTSVAPPPLALSRNENLNVHAWQRAFAFAIAATEIEGEATRSEVAAFVRRAINVVARDLGLSPAMVETEVASYRMLPRLDFAKVLASVQMQCQRLVDLIGAAISNTSLGYVCAVRPQDGNKSQSVDDAKLILSAVAEVDRIKTGRSSKTGTKAVSASRNVAEEILKQNGPSSPAATTPTRAAHSPTVSALSQFERRSGHYHDAELKVSFGQTDPAERLRDHNAGIDAQSLAAIPSMKLKSVVSPALEAGSDHQVARAENETRRHEGDALLPNNDIDRGTASQPTSFQRKAASDFDIADPETTSTTKDDQNSKRKRSAGPKPTPPKRGGWEL